ncbi:AraC family transcriptional regulator [Nocardia vinacea]|uniref:AraC family transcriptional regulator n=1 Tax=Nocardia vinacea TaxID=96468 RepID=A0ABZ1YND9_9NOCA|nr:AraC family transcriptional regulator [Nocardia vinacea]
MDVLRGSGLEWWSQTCASAFVPMLVTTDESCRGELHVAELDGIGVSRLICDSGELVRTTRLIESAPRNDILLSLTLGGALCVSAVGFPRRSVLGSSAFCTADRQYAISVDGPADVLTLRVPRERLHGSDYRLRDLHARPVNGCRQDQTKLLLDFMLSVLGVKSDGAAERRVLAGIAVDLLSLVLSDRGDAPGSVAGSAREGAYDLARVVVDKKFSDPTLTINQIAHQCGVSRRQLEMVFAEHGESPAALLRRVRLEAARSMLAAEESVSVTDIAHAVGFSDVTTFIRAFRRTHRNTPHAWRVSADR